MSSEPGAGESILAESSLGIAVERQGRPEEQGGEKHVGRPGVGQQAWSQRHRARE